MQQEKRSTTTGATATSGITASGSGEPEMESGVIPELRKHPSGEYEGAGVGRKEDIGRHPHAAARHGQQVPVKGEEATPASGVSAGTTSKDTTVAGHGETAGMGGATSTGGSTAGVSGGTGIGGATGMGGATGTAGMGGASGATGGKGEEGQGQGTTGRGPT